MRPNKSPWVKVKDSLWVKLGVVAAVVAAIAAVAAVALTDGSGDRNQKVEDSECHYPRRQSRCHLRTRRWHPR